MVSRLGTVRSDRTELRQTIPIKRLLFAEELVAIEDVKGVVSKSGT